MKPNDFRNKEIKWNLFIKKILISKKSLPKYPKMPSSRKGQSSNTTFFINLFIFTIIANKEKKLSQYFNFRMLKINFYITFASSIFLWWLMKKILRVISWCLTKKERKKESKVNIHLINSKWQFNFVNKRSIKMFERRFFLKL